MAARRRRDNVLVAVLAVLAVLGGGRTILGWFSTPPPGPSDDTTTKIVGRSQLAESFARDFVVTYLSASANQQDKIAEYVSSGQQVTLPSTGRQVSDPAVVFAEREVSNPQLEVWSVTISAKVGKGAGTAVGTSSSAAASTASSSGTTTSASNASATAGPGRQYYRVAVSVAAGRVRALSLPAAVDAPGRGSDLALANQNSCSPDTPFGQVVSGFLTAYLTGSGDLSRYTVPNSGMVAPAPAPFVSVETATVSTDTTGCGTGGGTARVLATVNPKATDGASPTLAYPLTMIFSAGQWQVQRIDPLPPLRNPLTVVVGDATQGPQVQSTPSSVATTSPSSAVQVPPAKQN
ncbi:conjugal transfer protein [Nocardia sp. CA2R105]|uniref:conjugal transfer protein n=1 Tax=Nocardia coffeae TaxID=2873381 RepID=UPI001CA750D5|nr:conjugal transfer protein [Nocardia coffeae]MBY8862728.1 conjugal transfer protein [Nocardia coffeae]